MTTTKQHKNLTPEKIFCAKISQPTVFKFSVAFEMYYGSCTCVVQKVQVLVLHGITSCLPCLFVCLSIEQHTERAAGRVEQATKDTNKVCNPHKHTHPHPHTRTHTHTHTHTLAHPHTCAHTHTHTQY